MGGDAAVKIDIYCERIDPSFWAEPLNAASNAAFLIAAFVGYLAARRAGRLDALTWAMILMLTAVGIGSFLWHTVAERWAGAADVIPIMLFGLIYIYASMRRYFGLSVWLSLVPTALFLPASAAFAATWSAVLPGVNLSQSYFPFLFAFLIVGGLLAARGHPAARWFFAAAAIFVASLTFRNLDAPLCAALPAGTHFLWHALNGTLLGALIVAFVRHGHPAGAPLAMRPARG